MNKLLMAAALAAAPISAASAAPTSLPDADPAIWVVQDEDTTIYMFGTFHALDGKSDWFNDEVRTAFDRSDELVLEIIAPEDPATVQALMAKYAVDPLAKPLSERLSPKARAKLAETLAAMGAPANAFDKMKPTFASMMLVLAQSQKLGFTGKQGAEAVLTTAAKSGRKRMGNLETIEFQLGMFDRLSEKEQIRMLESSLESLDEMPAMFTRMAELWNKGDAEGFAALTHDMDAQSPEIYRVVFSDRNKSWAEWIDQRLDRPGTVFLAVGTGHLAGKDSVQQFLASRGIRSKRAD
jgi:uncharacterized protein YbaP (TraB family)